MAWLAAIASIGVLACRQDTKPRLVEDKQELIGPPRRPVRKGPFKNPKLEPPPPRSEPQLEADALAQTLATAERLLAEGMIHRAITALRRCANKVPQSVRCEAKLAITMAENELYRAHASYFLAQASATDDPEVATELYRKLATAALASARFASAARALQVVIGRDEATAQDYADLARALQAAPQRIAEAAEAYAQAYRLNASQHDWLRKQGILLAQLGHHEAAIEALERYRETVGPTSAEGQAVAPKLAGLRAKLARSSQAASTRGGRP